MDLLVKLEKIFQRTLGVQNIGVKNTMDDIQEWDSLRHIQLLAEIEKEFNIQLSFEDSIEMISISNILETLRYKYNVHYE